MGIFNKKDEKTEVGVSKKIAIVLGGIVGVIALVYIGFAIYFGSHFIFGTKINGVDVAMKNVSQVEEYMRRQVSDYVLTLEKTDGKEEIVGKDIGIEYVPGEELKKLVNNQKNFLWIKHLWEPVELEAPIGVKYDEKALGEVIKGLACMDKKRQVKSVNAYPAFQSVKFEIVPEVVGTQIHQKKFHATVRESINGFQETLSLAEKGCYKFPKYVSDSKEVVKAAEKMNSYLGAKVTYDLKPKTEVVDSAVISKWVKVNRKNMKVTFDKKAVKKYIEKLADKYNTKWTTRNFTTATGNQVKVDGGDYGWLIDEEEEYKALTKDIKKGKAVTREPKYSSRAASHGEMDVGDTYAEVDLTRQKAYFIKNGKVVLESDIVTGNPNRGNATPQGMYSLSYKTMDAVLRGEKRPDGTYSYESPVKYWMPFNRGIGFHDATWQSSFGGSRYKSHGSHGCINMPREKAAKMYELISDGTPVVCHY